MGGPDRGGRLDENVELCWTRWNNTSHYSPSWKVYLSRFVLMPLSCGISKADRRFLLVFSRLKFNPNDITFVEIRSIEDVYLAAKISTVAYLLPENISPCTLHLFIHTSDLSRLSSRVFSISPQQPQKTQWSDHRVDGHKRLVGIRDWSWTSKLQQKSILDASDFFWPIHQRCSQETTLFSPILLPGTMLRATATPFKEIWIRGS